MPWAELLTVEQIGALWHKDYDTINQAMGMLKKVARTIGASFSGDKAERSKRAINCAKRLRGVVVRLLDRGWDARW